MLLGRVSVAAASWMVGHRHERPKRSKNLHRIKMSLYVCMYDEARTNKAEKVPARAFPG